MRSSFQENFQLSRQFNKEEIMGDGMKKVIISTDMGWDDTLSILYLMKNPAIEILGPDYVGKIEPVDPIAALAKNIFEKKTGSHAEGIPVPIFDPLATMIMAGGLKNYQSHQKHLDVNLTETEENNKCGKTYVVNSGDKKITIVQGVSQREFAIEYARVING